MTDTSTPPDSADMAVFLYTLGMETLAEFLCGEDQCVRDRMAGCLARTADALRLREVPPEKAAARDKVVAIGMEQARQLTFPQRKT